MEYLEKCSNNKQMKNNIFYLLVLVISLISCNQEKPFSISQDAVGLLTKETKMSELKTLFPNDSLADYNTSSQYKNLASGVTLYEKGGNKLLRIIPKSNEEESLIENIQIFDERFQTSKGISLQSTFKDIQDAYSIKRIENLIDMVVIFVNDSDAYFTIDKKHLPAELMFNTSSKVEQTQIPDEAPLKYLKVGW